MLFLQTRSSFINFSKGSNRCRIKYRMQHNMSTKNVFRSFSFSPCTICAELKLRRVTKKSITRRENMPDLDGEHPCPFKCISCTREKIATRTYTRVGNGAIPARPDCHPFQEMGTYRNHTLHQSKVESAQESTSV